MATRKKAKKPLAKKAMKKTQGGAQVDYFLKLKGIDGEATSGGDDLPTESITFSFGQTKTIY